MDLLLNNGNIVKLDTNLNLKKLMMINKDFNTDDFATMKFGREQEFKLTIMQGVQSVYLAYRQANMEGYMSYDEFLDAWDFDMETAMRVYGELMQGKKNKKEYSESLKKVTKK